MRSSAKQNRNLRVTENVIFIFAFGFIMYKLVSSYGHYVYDSIKGKGYIGAVIEPFQKHEYYTSVASILVIVNSTFILWEIITFIIRVLKQDGGNTTGLQKYRLIFKNVSTNYKPSFLSLLIHQLLPKLLLVNMFWIWLPTIQKLAPFTTNLQWYSWIYAYICWELSTWVFHFTSHRVRLLWCLHAPHHAPTEINMAVNWVHFFAESYYSTLIHLLGLTLMGVNPLMFLAIMSVDSAWGVFTHISEDSLKTGRMGFLQHLIITPSHHRVHHAKNPLYVDTNFCSFMPIWDWLFGTLQPFKEEVKIEYGITRELDVTNFSDLYFGEIFLLYNDVKNAEGLKNKLRYIFMPPGWTPVSVADTASVLRHEFLEKNPELGATSRTKVLTAIKSGFKIEPLQPNGASVYDSYAGGMK